MSPAGENIWGPGQCKNDRDGTVDHDERLRITGIEPSREKQEFPPEPATDYISIERNFTEVCVAARPLAELIAPPTMRSTSCSDKYARARTARPASRPSPDDRFHHCIFYPISSAFDAWGYPPLGSKPETSCSNALFVISLYVVATTLISNPPWDGLFRETHPLRSAERRLQIGGRAYLCNRSLNASAASS